MFLPAFGYIKSTLIDFPGEIASELFLSGCNMQCKACHNYKLATDKNEAMDYNEFMTVLSDIKDNKATGIVISGGEPTIWPALEELLEWLRANTKKRIKLDTNGSNPDVLRRLIDSKLIDYIAMDIKAPLEKYSMFSKEIDIIERINQSIITIRNSGLPYLFRCTMIPELTEEDYEILKALYPEIKFQKFVDRSEENK
jgi:pyruvate formate lyase activating enzyme